MPAMTNSQHQNAVVGCFINGAIVASAKSAHAAKFSGERRARVWVGGENGLNFFKNPPGVFGGQPL